ncbi:MAG: DUF5360 family protein [Myxococcota bacterium]
MREQDFRAIKPWLIATDLGMLTYWAVTAAKALGILDIPGEYLYAGYDDPLMVIWNWSFFPLDLVFSVTGLAAAALLRCGHDGWRLLAPVSLALTWCAGFMALSFWALQGSFDPVWWAMNGFLVAWPTAFWLRSWRQRR